MMTINLPCNPCANEICGNCVGEKLETMELIESAKFHCSCANNGHPNRITKNRPHKTIFSKKKDDEPVHTREVQSNSDDDFRDDDI